jgi:hypothetical protein
MVIEALSNYYVVKDLGEMRTFVGCDFLKTKSK